ncbi:uncharacterized protein LOC129702958 [Leucoraja erinacea]|uniref:uncharacterized protein LOC129702958 n=1 Tax=Leucoraja erinaceus TaxID=7782 RepID=UPI00245414B5|nr:uncharacterized protein LOC129702958 [Leucoraja erinacea]XP_055501044.1 uncharacterized protein LOC129702958 [Leucoraja erinacea]XP_055501045.1 uncharacterized protein LOC129702958 [Leucoraja erinacea]
MDTVRKNILILRWLELLLSFACLFLITPNISADFEWTIICLFCGVLCTTMNSIILFLESGASKDRCRHLSHFTEVCIFSLAVAFTTEALVQVISVIEIIMLLQPGQYYFEPPPTWLTDLHFKLASTMCICLASLLYWIDHHHSRYWIRQQALPNVTPKSIHGVNLTFSLILLFLLWRSEEKGIFLTICFYFIAHIISVFKAVTFILPLEMFTIKTRPGIICANMLLLFIYGKTLLLWPEHVLIQCSNEVFVKVCFKKEMDILCLFSFFRFCAEGVTFTILSGFNASLFIYETIYLLKFHESNMDNVILVGPV